MSLNDQERGPLSGAANSTKAEGLGVIETFCLTVLFVAAIAAIYGGGAFLLKRLHAESIGESVGFVGVAQFLGTWIFLVAAWRLRGPGELLEALAVRLRPSLYVALVGLGISLQFLLAAGSGALERWVPILRRSLEDRERMEAAMAIDRWPSAVAVVLGVVIVAPFTEELVFRGWLLPLLARKRGAVIGVLVTAVCFGLVHLEPSAVIYASAAGLVLGWLRLVTGSLRASLLVHAVSNAVPVVLSPTVFLIPGFNDGASSTAAMPSAIAVAALVGFVVFLAMVWRVSQPRPSSL